MKRNFAGFYSSQLDINEVGVLWFFFPNVDDVSSTLSFLN